MITRKYTFSIATKYVNSEWSEVVEFQFDDDATEGEIEDQVNELYTEWIFQQNYGGFTELKEN